MRLLLLKMLVGAVVGLGTGIADDLNKFRNYKKRDEFADFCWPVACARWLSGAIYGGLAAVGITGAQGAGIIPEG